MTVALRHLSANPQKLVNESGFAILCASLLLATACVKADDWPQWRGANRDGVWSETGILQTFPPGGLKISWCAPVGFGFSSPIVAHGRVYVTDSELARPKVRERVHCFSESTGQLLWIYSQEISFPDWGFTRGTEAMPNATPIASDDRVYATGSFGHRLFCIETNKGTLLWEKDLAKEYQIDETAMISASPIVEGNLLILLLGGKPDAGVVAFDKTSGQEVWRALDESAAHSSPIVIAAAGRRHSSSGPCNRLAAWIQRRANFFGAKDSPTAVCPLYRLRFFPKTGC